MIEKNKGGKLIVVIGIFRFQTVILLQKKQEKLKMVKNMLLLKVVYGLPMLIINKGMRI